MKFFKFEKKTAPKQELIKTYLGSSVTIDRTYRDDFFVCVVRNYERLSISGLIHALEQWCQQNDCQFFWDRVLYNTWSNKWESTEMGGGDRIFIRSKNESAILLAALRWA